MLRFLFLVGLGQSLAVLSNVQQDLTNGEAKYNGPSHQYLPAAAVKIKDTLATSRDSRQPYKGPPQYNGFTQGTQTKPTGESGKYQDYDLYTVGSSHSHQSSTVEQNKLPHTIRDYYHNPDPNNNYPYSTFGITENPCPSTDKQQQKDLYHKPHGNSYLAIIIPAPTMSTPSPPPTLNETQYQGSKPYNDPPRNSKLSFIIPEITTTGPALHRDTSNHYEDVSPVTDSKVLQVPSQQYLAPLQSFSNSRRPKDSIESTTTVLPSYTSRYHGPSNQYLPATMEAHTQTTSPPYYIRQSQNFGSYPNNRPWKPIHTERTTTTKRPQTGPSPIALHQGYRYNTPAQSHPSPKSQTVNGINYNELGMGLNSTSKDQQVIETQPKSEGKTEIETQQGYVYGQTQSKSETDSQAITHLNPVPIIPSTYHFNRPGQRFEDYSADLYQNQYQTQQGHKRYEIPLKVPHSGERPSSSPTQNFQQSSTNSFHHIRNGNGKVNLNLTPIETHPEHKGSLNSTSEGFEQYRPLPSPAQYEQQSGSNSYTNGKGNFENMKSAISPKKPAESLRPTTAGSQQYIPSFGTDQDEQQISQSYYLANPRNQEGNTNFNIQQILQKQVENFRPTTGHFTVYTTAAEVNYSQPQQQQGLYPTRLAVNSDKNRELNSQPLGNSRPLSGSSPFGVGQYDKISRPTFIPSSADANRNYDLTQNQEELIGNVSAVGEAPSENRSSGTDDYKQQQNKPESHKYYSIKYPYPDSKTFQPTFSVNAPSSKDITQPATSSVNTRPYPNLQYTPFHQLLRLQESQGNNPTSKPTSAPTLSESQELPGATHPGLSTLTNPQQTLSQNPGNLNNSPIPQEELQRYYNNRPISSLPLGLLPPTLTKLESQTYFLAGQDHHTLNSNLSLGPSTEYRRYPTSNLVIASSQDRNPLSPNSQGQLPQLLSGFTPLQTSSEHITSQTAEPQQIGNRYQQVFQSDSNPSFQGSIIFHRNLSLFHMNSGKLNTWPTQISQTNPSGNFTYQYIKPSQSSTAPSSEIFTPYSESLHTGKPTNSKPALQSNTLTQRPTVTFFQTPQNLAGSTYLSPESQGYRLNHNEVPNLPSTLPQTEAETLNSSLNQKFMQNPQTAKQFPLQIEPGTQASHQQQQLFLGHSQTTAPQVPGTGSVSNFFGPSGSVSNTAPSTIGNNSNLNPSKTVSSPAKPVNFLRDTNFLQMPSHSYIMNSYYTMYPGHLEQGQQSESVKQSSKLKAPSMSKPMVFVDSPYDVASSRSEASKPMVFVESSPIVPPLVRQSHLIYGSPMQEPSNDYLPPSIIVQPPYIKK